MLRSAVVSATDPDRTPKAYAATRQYNLLHADNDNGRGGPEALRALVQALRGETTASNVQDLIRFFEPQGNQDIGMWLDGKQKIQTSLNHRLQDEVTSGLKQHLPELRGAFLFS